jgi:allantoin racemase
LSPFCQTIVTDILPQNISLPNEGGRDKSLKIWYQSYTRIGFDPKWKNIENNLTRHIQRVARPDTRVDIYGVEKMALKMTESGYIQMLHLSQVVENALRAEREGYDAFCLGGTLDLGGSILREVLDVPVAFILESSLFHACLLGTRFAIIGLNETMLRKQMELVRYYGLESRMVSSEHLKWTMTDFLEFLEKDPQRVVDAFIETAKKAIEQGAGALIPGFGPLGSFLGERGLHEIEEIPIVDIIASVIKTAEVLVDLAKIGLKRSRKGFGAYLTKEELMAARKLYKIE